MTVLTFVRDVAIAATEEVTVDLVNDPSWLDTPEGQDWLSANPNIHLIPNDLLDATPWREAATQGEHQP